MAHDGDSPIAPEPPHASLRCPSPHRTADRHPAGAGEFWIVFGSFRGGEFSSSIHAVRPDGSDERELSPHPGGFPASLDPWVAPDGDLIAFSRGSTSHQTSVWLLDPASGDEEQVSGQVMTRFKNGRAWPSLRPGTLHMTYVQESSNGRELVMQEWPGGAPVELGSGEFPAWSPDGSKLVFVRDDRLFLHDFGTGLVHPVPTELGATGYPAWTADGERLLVVAAAPDGADIYEISLHGETIRRITNTPETAESAPSMSPDGRYVAWAAKATDAGEGWQKSLFVLDTQDGTVAEITSGRYHDTRPTWASKLP